MVASSNDQLVDDLLDDLVADNGSQGSYADLNNDESDADSVLDPCPLAVWSQLCCSLNCKAQRLASSAVGLGYHTAGAMYGSVIGLRRGVTK